MTDRLLLVAALTVVVVVAVLVLRRRPIVRSRALTHIGLPPGVYLLTSDGCDTCERARNTLTRSEVAHTELSWQKNPDVFARLGVDAVPSVVRVEADGNGIWWRGGVPRGLRG